MNDKEKQGEEMPEEYIDEVIHTPEFKAYHLATGDHILTENECRQWSDKLIPIINRIRGKYGMELLVSFGI